MFEARRFRERRRGLVGVVELPTGVALRIHRCRSIHTLGMRFALDLVWLDRRERVVRVERDVGPGRVRTCLRARTVIEARSGEGERFAHAWLQRFDDRSG